MSDKEINLETIVAWAKRRGFVFPASDIYGGLANTYDYGPYGTQLKNNVANLWWKRFIQEREDNYGIDSTIILRPEVWEASGHTDSFADVMVEDAVNHKRYRADHLVEDALEKLTQTTLNSLVHEIDLALFDRKFDKKIREQLEVGTLNGFQYSETGLSDEAVALLKGQVHEGIMSAKVDGLDIFFIKWLIEKLEIKSPDGNVLGEPKRFNQLFETKIGIIAGEKNSAYLRGEIAQGLFLNFKNIRDSFSPKLPFGIGQVGKAFRNEITPGKFTYRTLEFDLMEFEYFFDPAQQSWEELFEYWQKEMHKFALELGLKEEQMRWRAHEDFERSHYSERTEDLEFDFPWGFKEMWGLAYRTDFDLKNHSEKSGKDLSYIYPDGSRVIPHVVEPTFGLSRTASILMFAAYTEETLEDGSTRTVLKFDPKIAPVTVAVLPLQKDEKLEGVARDIFSDLSKQFTCEFENKGNIGKMYRRQDEIGTPFCVTVDYESLEDKMVTVRDRDTMQQERIAIAELEAFISNKLNK